MKALITIIILTFLFFGCKNKELPKESNRNLTEIKEITKKRFSQVINFPIIKDSTEFISSLREICELEVDELSNQIEEIVFYKKVKINGSNKDYFLIEYDYKDGCGAAFPWKYQIILTLNGEIIKILSGLRYEFVEIFKNENPFLLTVTSTSKGNGGHQVYKISADTLENIYEGYFDYNLQTYDAHQDNSVFEPNELNFKVKDYNNDGVNDISFSGNTVFIQGQTKNGDWYDGETINGKLVTYSIDNPFKKTPIKYIFIYDKQSGHFKTRKNYNQE